MKLNYNFFAAAIIIAYSVPGLFLAPYIPFLENYLITIDIWQILVASMIQAFIFFFFFPRFNLINAVEHVDDLKKNHVAINAVICIFLGMGFFVIGVEIDVLIKLSGYGDRNTLYQIYRGLAEVYPIEKIKTFIAVFSIYLIISNHALLGISMCIAISAIDFGFGNRGFAYYTLIIIIFVYLPSIKNPKGKKLIYLLISFLFLLILLRTYIFSGDSEISGIDNLLAIFGEFIFTSSVPILVHQLKVQDDHVGMLIQFFGIDKIFGTKSPWVGEIVQNELEIPIGLACGPLCEAYYYAPGTIYSIIATILISISYATFIWLSLKFSPFKERFTIVLVQVLLLRDFIRTGLVISFSTLVLWTLITLILNRLIFSRKKNE
jgi:hypothetical protein